MDYARPLVAGLVAAVMVAVLAALGAGARADRKGWRHLTPSAMHWTGVLLGGGLVLLMGWVRLFVGSTRDDAANQMAILTWLIAGFALGTVVVAVNMAAIRRRAIRWRGTRIVWRHLGREHQADLADVNAIALNWLGQRVLIFTDGRRFALDPYARGVQELIEAVEARLGTLGG